MVSPNVDKVFQAAQSLSDAEQQELRRLLEERAHLQREPAVADRLRQALVERGLVAAQRCGVKDSERFRRWRPISIQGEPLSATIIEERR